tara:strand:+ start:450 stop:1700 length:1251 start_codon:yes stop_codon:yes gene_type:complete
MREFDYDIEQIRERRDERIYNRKDTSFVCVIGVVLKINYADTSDHRASAVGELDVTNYGSPTADVYLPTSRQVLTRVKIVQHGSARQNVSVWLPAVSTHMKDGEAIYVPRIDPKTSLTIEPIQYIKPMTVNDFDGDSVIVQSLHIGSGDYDYFIIGTVPSVSPARERLHYSPRSQQVTEVQKYDESYLPNDMATTAFMTVRANRLSSLDFTHPLLGIHADGSTPEADGLSSDDQLKQTNEDQPDRMMANPIGDERYLAHNGAVVRIDQQGNVLLDTTLAGLKNNRMDIEAAAAFGDAGHVDINVNKRIGQGLVIRLGGEVVFSIRHDGSNDIVSLGKELAQAFSSVLGERLAAVFDNHQHLTTQGPTTVPLPIQDPLTAASFDDVAPTGAMKPSNIGSANESENHAVMTDKVIVRS